MPEEKSSKSEEPHLTTTNRDLGDETPDKKGESLQAPPQHHTRDEDDDQGGAPWIRSR